MNREIKFRAWIDAQSRMVGPLSIHELHPKWSFPLHWAKLMQFTGLKDKNGKEIYEGDILQSTVAGDGYLDVVKWSDLDAAWSFESILGQCTVLANDIDVKRGDVIGNIYENPEVF